MKMVRLLIVAIGLLICNYASLVKAQTVGYNETRTEITVPPASEQPVYIMVGDTLTLICANDEGAEVAWYKDDAAIDDTQDSGMLITSSKKKEKGILTTVSKLVKSSVNENDTGTFECRAPVTNGSHKTLVFVFSISSNKAILTNSKQPVILQCNVTGLNSHDSLKWYRHGRLLSSNKYKTDDKNDTLTISEIDENDAGEYTCSFEIGARNFSHNVSLSAKPYVRPFEKSKNLVQGDPLVLECKAWGHPTPYVHWTRDDQPLDESDGRVSFSHYNDIANGTMRIEKMDFADRADYGCHAFNEFGNSTEVTLVRVKDKLAALWPFLGICAEVAILCLIIFIYEKRRAKKMEEEDAPEEAGQLTNSNDHRNEDIRQRK